MGNRGRWIARAMWLAIGAVGGLGCGAEVAREVTDEHVEHALTLDALDAAPTCEVDDLVDGETCAGPWQYARWKTCARRDPACGPQYCPQFLGCSQWSHGHVAVTRSLNVSFDAPMRCTTRTRAARRAKQDDPGDPGGSTTCVLDRAAVDSECRRHADRHVGNFRADVPAHLQSLVTGTVVSTSYTSPRSSCSIRVNDVDPRYAYTAACGCAVATIHPTCVITHPECGARDDDVFSSPGLAASEIVTEDPHVTSTAPRCTTCDELPIETVDQARAKLACLRETWDAMEPAPGTMANGTMTATARLVGSVDTVNLGDLVVWQDPPGTQPQPPVPPPVDTSGPGLGALDVGVRMQLASRLQLLDELVGHRLAAEDRTWIASVVDEWQAPAPECHEETIGLPSACSLPLDARAAIGRCERFAASHVAPERAALAFFECAEQLEALDGSDAEIESTCEGAVLRERLVAHVTALAAKTMDAVATLDGIVELPRAIHTLDRWNAAVALAIDLGAFSADGEPNDAELRGLRSELLGRFWQRAQARSRVLDALSTSTDVEDALGLATERGMQLDRAVVDALATSSTGLPARSVDGLVVAEAIALPDGYVARDAVLGELLGDALSALSARLEDLALFHDLAQTFRASGSAPTATRVSDRWGMLAALENGALLATRASAAVHVDDGWPATMARLAAANVHLRASLEALGVEGALGETATAELDPSLRPLAALVAEASRRRASFLATGRLEPSGPRTLHAGVNAWEREQVASDLQRRLVELASARAEYEGDLATTVNGLLAESDVVQRRARLMGEVEERSVRFEALGRDLLGLLGAQGVEDARLGTLTAAHAAMSGSLDEGRLLPVGDTMRFSLDGTSARATGPIETADHVPSGASRTVRLQPGQVLALHASGTWSPTCLMKTRRYWDEGSGQLLESWLSDGAEIGPEGFHLVRNTSGFSAEAHSDSTSTTGSASVGISFEACAGTPGLVATLTGGSARACMTASAGVTWSSSNSDTETEGSESRTSASFSSGFRLAGTPFEGLPAGALLIVETNVPVGAAPRVIRDVHPVRSGQNLVLVAQPDEGVPVDLFFVTNDVRCDDADTTQALLIEARVMEGEVGVAAATIGAMQVVLDDLRAFGPTVVAQGRVLPSQLASLRSTAYAQLVARSGRTLDAIPPALVGLFDAFVDRELVRIERAVAAVELQRAVDVELRQIAVLSTELREVERQGRLAALAPSWALRNLDGEGLRHHVATLASFVRRFLFPVLELWYPDAIALLADDVVFRGQLDTLRSASLATRTVDLVALVEAALGRVRSAYLAVSPGARDEASRPLVAVGLVRGNPSIFERTSLAKSDPASAATLWSAITALRTGTIAIDPEEVYSLYGGVGGQLACTDAVPVIQRAALVVVRNGEDFINQDYNYERRWLRGRASVGQPFVTEQGLVQYTLADARWQEFQLPVLYASPSEPLEVFVERALSSAANELPRGPAGLSPFASFQVDFQGLAALRALGRDGVVATADRVHEVVLVMQVDTRVAAQPMSWVAACDPMVTGEPGDEEPLPGDEEPLPPGDEEPLPPGDDEPLPPGDDEPFPPGDDEPFPEP